MYPHGLDEEYNGYVSLFLAYCGEKRKLTVKHRLELSTPSSEVDPTELTFIDDAEHTTMFGKTDIPVENIYTSQGCCNFYKTKALLKKLNQDMLVITVTLTVTLTETTHVSPFKRRSSQIRENWLNQFGSFFDDETDADITFLIQAEGDNNEKETTCTGTEKSNSQTRSVKETKIKAHKLILGLRSPVFKAMFSSNNNMQESQQSEVKIVGVSERVFRELLRFLYCGSVSDDCVFDEIGFELWVASDRYEAPELAELCDIHLSETLSPEKF